MTARESQEETTATKQERKASQEERKNSKTVGKDKGNDATCAILPAFYDTRTEVHGGSLARVSELSGYSIIE
ncbi:hypothetical protein K0M31_009706 [Melipona bicolor]|uniref:Uncharacterized protein n=1 Tax=Melipona bicolor TaxID=60889 RepID=A0AA40FNR7_9HYME|nr:hypothetical protein K0M31_009706 [Melipona bicolor]